MAVFRSCLSLCCVAWLYTAGLAAQSMPPASQATEWTLDAVVAAALRQHPLIEAAKARVDVARGLRRTAGAVPDPLVSYTTEGGPFPGQTSSALFEPERAVFFSVPFDPFVQRRYRIERTDAEIRSSTSSLAATERQVVRDASEAFYRVALGQAAVVAAQESRTVLDRLVEYLRTRVAQGASPEAELIRAEVERDQTAIDLAFADVELTRARGQLRPFLGAGGDLVTIRVAAGPAASPGALPALDALLQRSEQRPELIAARARVASATADVALQRRSVIRDFGASFGVKRMNGVNTMLAGVSVAVPLFDRNRGEIDRATAELTVAERELEWIQRTVLAEVTSAYDAARKLSEQIAGLEKSFLARAEESARISVATYQEGAGSLLLVLDATRGLAASRLNYSRMLFAYQESLAILRLVTGDQIGVR